MPVVVWQFALHSRRRNNSNNRDHRRHGWGGDSSPRWPGQADIQRASASSRPSLTANDKNCSSKRYQGFAGWRPLPILTSQQLRSFANCRRSTRPEHRAFNSSGRQRRRDNGGHRHGKVIRRHSAQRFGITDAPRQLSAYYGAGLNAALASHVSMARISATWRREAGEKDEATPSRC